MKRIKDFNAFNESLEVQPAQQAFYGTMMIPAMKDPDEAKNDIDGDTLDNKVPQFDIIKTLSIILTDKNLSDKAIQIFPELDLKKAVKNPEMIGPVEEDKLVQIFNNIILKDYTLRGKYDALPETIDETKCPECSERYTSSCKCMTTKSKTLEDLKRGHGKRCPNGHTWSYDTPDGKVIILK